MTRIGAVGYLFPIFRSLCTFLYAAGSSCQYSKIRPSTTRAIITNIQESRLLKDCSSASIFALRAGISAGVMGHENRENRGQTDGPPCFSVLRRHIGQALQIRQALHLN